MLDCYSDDIIFCDDFVLLTRFDFKTFEPDTFLTTGLINAWSSYLNSRELLMSPESPSRFFFTTMPCVSFLYSINFKITTYALLRCLHTLQSFTIVDTPANSTIEQVRNRFYERISAEMENMIDFKMGKIDMVLNILFNASFKLVLF